MDEEDESLPIFRHFTREDLAIIDNAIFENKLREKKRAEKRAQNVKVKFQNHIILITGVFGKPMLESS